MKSQLEWNGYYTNMSVTALHQTFVDRIFPNLSPEEVYSITPAAFYKDPDFWVLAVHNRPDLRFCLPKNFDQYYPRQLLNMLQLPAIRTAQHDWKTTLLNDIQIEWRTDNGFMLSAIGANYTTIQCVDKSLQGDRAFTWKVYQYFLQSYLPMPAWLAQAHPPPRGTPQHPSRHTVQLPSGYGHGQRVPK